MTSRFCGLKTHFSLGNGLTPQLSWYLSKVKVSVRTGSFSINRDSAQAHGRQPKVIVPTTTKYDSIVNQVMYLIT